MSSRRVLLFSFGMAAFLTGVGSLIYFLSKHFERVPIVFWATAMVLVSFVALAAAIYINFTLRIRRIQRKILESSNEPFVGFDENMTLEKLEQSVEEWSLRQKKLIQELESREEFRREYIGNVSHELKTPIFNIQGYILTLLDGAKDDPKIAIAVIIVVEVSVVGMCKFSSTGTGCVTRGSTCGGGLSNRTPGVGSYGALNT